MKQLAEALKTNQITPQRIVFLESLTLVSNVHQALRIRKMERNKMNAEEIEYLAESLKVNKVTEYSHLSSHLSPLPRLTDANTVGCSMESNMDYGRSISKWCLEDQSGETRSSCVHYWLNSFKTLTTLDLCFSNIGPGGVRYLVEALKINRVRMHLFSYPGSYQWLYVQLS